MGDAPAQEVIRIGVPEDLAGVVLAPTLGAFARQRGARLRLEVTSGLSNDLLTAYERGGYDLVLAKQRHPRGVCSWPERLVWLDSRRHPCVDRDPLPLAVFPEGALYREETFGWLDGQGRRWHVAFCSASLASLQAAAGVGLGVSLLPRRAAQPGHRVLTAEDGFPEVPGMWLALHHPSSASPATLELAAKLARRCDALT